MGLILGKKVDGGYQPSFLHRLVKPKITGNQINGLDEKLSRRPTPLYHWYGKYKLKLPFSGVQRLGDFTAMWKHRKNIALPLKHIKKSDYYSGKPHVSVKLNPANRSPEEWTRAVKAYAHEKGADLVGITRLRKEWVYEGFDISKKWIVMLGLAMEHEELVQTDGPESGVEVLKIYAQGQEVAWHVTDWLRAEGWDAEGHGGPDASPVTMVPAALACGFGELGKHGSIINRKLGSSFRLAYVVTDTPMIADEEDEFGVDDFCMKCQVCTKACPAEAISTSKQLVRGVEKWYVNFDKCVPYFNDDGGCGICIAQCPWSRPGIADNLVMKIARNRKRKEAESKA